MKKQVAALAAGLLLIFAGAGFAVEKTPSTLSLYKGKYVGSVVYASIISGTTTGKFSASKTKENGSLVLTSPLSFGGNTFFLNERFNFRKKRVTYSLQVFVSSGSGTGRVKVGKKVITYSAFFTVNGMGYTVQGRITKNKKSMTIIETFSGGAAFSVVYNLKLTGK